LLDQTVRARMPTIAGLLVFGQKVIGHLHRERLGATPGRTDGEPPRKRRRTDADRQRDEQANRMAEFPDAAVAELDAIGADVLTLVQDPTTTTASARDGLWHQTRRWERVMQELSAALGPDAYLMLVNELLARPTQPPDPDALTVPLDQAVDDTGGDMLHRSLEDTGGRPVLFGHVVTRPGVLLGSRRADGTKVFVVVDPTGDTVEYVPVPEIAGYARRFGVRVSPALVDELKTGLLNMITGIQARLGKPLDDGQRERLGRLTAPALEELYHQLRKQPPPPNLVDEYARDVRTVLPQSTVRIVRGRIESSGSPAIVYLNGPGQQTGGDLATLGGEALRKAREAVGHRLTIIDGRDTADQPPGTAVVTKVRHIDPLSRHGTGLVVEVAVAGTAGQQLYIAAVEALRQASAWGAKAAAIVLPAGWTADAALPVIAAAAWNTATPLGTVDVVFPDATVPTGTTDDLTGDQQWLAVQAWYAVNGTTPTPQQWPPEQWGICAAAPPASMRASRSASAAFGWACSST